MNPTESVQSVPVQVPFAAATPWLSGEYPTGAEQLKKKAPAQWVAATKWIESSGCTD
ncbi:MAG: hypothetical protein ACKN9U_17300 [Pirellulaceae bacterium]